MTVSDEGIGFDSSTMPSGVEEGAGFGLFTIRERLELMGGVFEILSNPGQGSRFVLSVPVASATAIELPPQENFVLPEAQSKPPAYRNPERKIRVMLVDDHAVVRQGIGNLLGDEADIEVVGEAADGPVFDA